MEPLRLLSRILRMLAVWLMTAVYWTGVLAVHLLFFKRLPAPWMAQLMRFWGRTAFWLIGVRLEQLNASTISEQSPRVVIVNHQSALDMGWGAAICPPAPLVIGKKEILYVPIFNVIWWVLDFIRIDRSNHVAAIAALEGVAEKIVRERRSLVVSPEGTRSPDGSILRFKKGAFFLARQAQVPICPVVVSGAFELLPKGSLWPRPGVIKLKFLPPVSTEGLTKENEAVFIERIRQDMIRALKELKEELKTT